MIPCGLLLLTAPLSIAPIDDAIQKGRYSEALSQSNMLLQENPNNIQILCAKGRILAYMGKYDAAETAFRTILDNNKNHHEALLGSAYVALWSSNFPLAEKRVKHLLKINSHTDDAHVIQARIALSKKDWNGAIALLSAAQSDNPHFARQGKEYYLLYAKAEKAIEQKDFDQALVILDSMHRNWPNDDKVILMKARVLAWEGRTVESRKLYNSVLAQNPENVEARVGLARALLYAKKYPQAQKAARTALELDPSNAEARSVIASASNRMGEGGAVGDQIPEDLKMAQEYYNRRQYSWALEEVERVLEKKPKYPEALLLRGNVFIGLSQYDKAHESFNAVLAQNPSHTDALQSKGGLDLLEGKYIEAFELFEHLKESDPFDVDSRANFFALQPLVEREAFIRPTLSSEKEKDLVTNQSTTKINTIDGLAHVEGMLREGLRFFGGLQIHNEQMENLIATKNNYNAISYTPNLGIRYIPTVEFELLAQAAFASYRDLNKDVLFPFQDRFLFQPSIKVRYLHNAHFAHASVYQDGFISRNFAQAQSLVQKSTHVTGAYEYRFAAPYNGVGVAGEAAWIGGPYSNTYGKGEVWVRGCPLNSFRGEIRGGLSSFDKVVENYFSFLRKWTVEGTFGLFYAVRNETFVELSYRARYETLSSLSNQGVAVTNPSVNVPQDLSRKDFFSNRITLEGRHIIDEDFRIEGNVFYDQVNNFYTTVGGSLTLRAFF